jgi:glycine/D-amino acid oxidase-like deaminating enzyme
MKTSPYWTDISPRPDDLQADALPAKADVAIIGAGYTGLNAAITFADRGIDTVLLEKEVVGYGGSSRNGGMFAPGISAGIPKLEKRHGIEIAERMWRWTVQATQYVKDIIQSEAIDCDLVFNGGIHLAWRPAHLDEDRDYASYLEERFGYSEMSIVERGDLHTKIGSPAYSGGMANNFGGGVNPAAYTYGLAQAALRRGALLVEGAEVLALRRRDGHFELATPKGKLSAERVLMATNGYTPNLVPRIRSGVLPVGSAIITTQPLSEDLQQELSPEGRMFYDSKNFLNYFRLTPDGRLLFGGRRKLAADLDPTRSARELKQRLIQVFPQLNDTPITHSWTGRVAFTFDRTPHIGREGGIYYAYGYNGHGLAASSYMGREVALVMLGEIESSPFQVIPHPRIPFSSLSHVYLPLLTGWFRMVDRVA